MYDSGGFGFRLGEDPLGCTPSVLTPYRTRSARLRCVRLDLDVPCGDALTFGRAPGPAAAAR